MLDEWMKTTKTSRRKEQLIAWLDAQTDKDAWLTHTYRQIAAAISVGDDKIAPSTVRDILTKVMADQLDIEPSEVIARKNDYRQEAQGRMTPEKLEQLKEWRTQEKPMSIIDCAYRLEMSLNTIRKHCKEHGWED